MNIREEFEILSQKEYSFSLINEIVGLKSKCVQQSNMEFFYKCNLLISDIYIDQQNNQEALNLLLKDIKTIDQALFSNIYLNYLDRLIYLYINRRNYNIALKYINQKESLINKDDKDDLNRLYLEYSYIYGEMNDLDKSEHYLNNILNNSPDIYLKSYVLSNLTKIYIDKSEIALAKSTLNNCLIYNSDHEGEVYCDYLLAKISVLEGNINEALQLYENIFVNEDINNMTLGIMNDYLKLLNSQKMYEKALLLMNKLALFINASDDLEIKKAFYHNKLDYFIGNNENANITATLKEIELIEKEISDNEQSILAANFEENKNEIVEEAETAVFHKIDSLTSLVDVALKGNNLREIIMDFSNKVHNFISFNELTFVLFNKVDEQEFQMSSKISCLKYKNNRLYEKQIEYDTLRKTIVEVMVNNNKPIALDYASTTIELNDIFTNKLYDKTINKYLNCIPCLYNGDAFACVIYSSDDTDLTEQSNIVLLKVATKLLESALIIQFVNENRRRVENTCDMVVRENHIGLFYTNNDTIYFSEDLKNMFQMRYSSISIANYKSRISKSDLFEYEKAISSGQKYMVKYKFELFDKIIQVIEIGEPCKDVNGNIMYYQGTIKLLDEQNISHALSSKDLRNKIMELKQKTNIIEFKFSMIKIEGTIDEYLSIKNTFGVIPYFINNDSFIIILENEANQRTIDRLIKNYNDRCSVIRYPRDIINIDEMLNLVNMMLENKIIYFNNDIYKLFIKKNNLLSRIDGILSKGLKLKSLTYNAYDNRQIFEIKPVILGLDEKENIRDFLTGDFTVKYDEKFIEYFTSKNIRKYCFFDISNEFLFKILNEYDLNKFNNVTFVLYEINNLTPIIFDKLIKLNKQIFINYKLIDKLDAYYFTSKIIKGICMTENPDDNFYNRILNVANMFDLSLISYNNSKNYKKLIYFTGESELID